MDKVTRRERRAEAVSNRGPSSYQPNALPLGQTAHRKKFVRNINLFEKMADQVQRNISEQHPQRIE